jgi:adenylate cyclase
LLYLDRQCFGAALSHVERAAEINPANPVTKADLGILLSRIGRAEEGLEYLRDARRIDPYFAPLLYRPAPGVAQFVMRRYVQALEEFDRGAPTDAEASAMMAGCCAKLGLAERTQRPFENACGGSGRDDSSSGCGPERTEAGWPKSRAGPSVIQLT